LPWAELDSIGPTVAELTSLLDAIGPTVAELTSLLAGALLGAGVALLEPAMIEEIEAMMPLVELVAGSELSTGPVTLVNTTGEDADE